MRERIVQVLEPDFDVIGAVSDGKALLEAALLMKPDVCAMDISMPGLNGLEAIGRLTHEFPDVRVIVLSMHENEEYVCRALKSGAVGYLLKKAATAELQNALTRIKDGEIYLSREIADRMRKRFPVTGLTQSKSPLDQLTSRQREILQLIAEGQNTKEIAELLKLSPKTVEYHRLKLMETLNLHDIPNLVRFALRMGVIPLDQ